MESKVIQENFDVIIKEGWLEKRSRFLKDWRRRWIVLTPNTLSTLKNERDYHNPTEQIPLSEFNSILPSDEESKRANTFKIETLERKFYFLAHDQNDRNEWLSALGQIFIQTGVKNV